MVRDDVEVAVVHASWELWEIRSLYPMVGLTSIVVTLGYLICWILERPKKDAKNTFVEKQTGPNIGFGCRRCSTQ